MMRRILTLAFVALTLLISCGKDDNQQEQGKQNDIEQLAGEWRIKSESENGRDLLNDCSKQNTYVFRSDNTYTRVYYSVVEKIVGRRTDTEHFLLKEINLRLLTEKREPKKQQTSLSKRIH